MKQPPPDRQSFSFKLVNWVLLLSCAVIWGFSYFFIKRSLTGFVPLEVAGLRLLFGGLVLVPFVFFVIKKIVPAQFIYILICATIGNGLPTYLYPVAQTHISSSVTGIINSLTPLCTYIIGISFFGLQYRKMKMAGVLLGLLGAVCLIAFRSKTELYADFAFILVALSVPFMYGINSNVIKKHLVNLPAVPLTALMYFVSLVIVLPLLLFSGLADKIQTDEAAQSALPYTIMLGVFGTALAMSLFNVLIKRVSIMFAASVTYLMPVVALFIGLWDNEHVGIAEYMGLALILSGVVLINTVKE
jgi:drug/metabolite transporter (DMT)-like permease